MDWSIILLDYRSIRSIKLCNQISQRIELQEFMSTKTEKKTNKQC
jgi:hypothetical protein